MWRAPAFMSSTRRDWTCWWKRKGDSANR
jgi:hypothetical protein